MKADQPPRPDIFCVATRGAGGAVPAGSGNDDRARRPELLDVRRGGLRNRAARLDPPESLSAGAPRAAVAS
jgi:hypothetical protein